ncbi:MAG TPA: beta-N-acetylglucosaminidase [Lutibacter sp.]|nr:beta-N-acetylglucosaminidase [Lutibacter sp.]
MNTIHSIGTKEIFLILLLLISSIKLQAQQPDPLLTKDHQAQEQWVDSILSTMTVREKVGQLIMVQTYSNRDKEHQKYIENLIEKHQIGGLTFMQGSPHKQGLLNNLYQAKSKIPLLISFDGEWGLNMRIDSTYRFPWNMTLGAIRDNNLLEKLGKRIGEQHKRLGIHINFAPVIDINTNPNNPIIGNRSYGEDKYNVTQKASAFIKGLQGEKVLACGKHFPGHGDTAMDSHKTLPSILFDKERIDSIELYPYKKLFGENMGSVMTAHLSIPSLESDKTIPTSISKKVVTNLLQDKLGFNGLIITDALNMKGASNFAENGAIDLAAFLAGNDILLFPQDVAKAISYIEKAYSSEKFSEARLNYSVRKILKTKYWAGLNNYKPVDLNNLHSDLNTTYDTLLDKELIDQSITLLKNGTSFPIKDVQQKIAYIKLGDSEANATPFVTMLKKYTSVTIIKTKERKKILQELKKYDLVIIGFHKSNANPWKNYKFSKDELKLIKKISTKNKVVLSVFASPYSLLQIADFKNIEAIVLGYQNSVFAQELTAQKIFGAIETNGKLPVSIGIEFPAGHGIFSHSLKRLSYGKPEEVGMSFQKLQRLDSLANVVLTDKMSPGMQVLVAKNGKVVFHKSYGYFTYNKKRKVINSDIYDLASVTKILGGLPLLMKAEEEGKYNLDDTLGELMPVLKGSNKEAITMRKALAHNAQLKAWINYYPTTFDSITKKPLTAYYRNKSSKDFNIKISEKLYLRSDYQDTIYKHIAVSELREKPGYKYSGLIFYLMKDYIFRNYNKQMNILDDEWFYKPLGANTLTYLPLEKFSKERIAPTEKDTYFRNETIQGTVHDMGAAMMGGVSGNAGLFGNANDIAKMMQMYLQGGFYGGKRYFQSKTINKFNTQYYAKDSIRRGLGFDKPQIDPEVKATCGCVSDKSFGHAGFTGTYVWADPETELVYIFLSNRTYPTMNNRQLYKEDIRTKAHQIIVDAILE